MRLRFTLTSIEHARNDCRRVVVYIQEIPSTVLDRGSTVTRQRAGRFGVWIGAGASDSVFSKTFRPGPRPTQPPTKRELGVLSQDKAART
jgi:hypothetical protein